jgi:hypothetical protein
MLGRVCFEGLPPVRSILREGSRAQHGGCEGHCWMMDSSSALLGSSLMEHCSSMQPKSNTRRSAHRAALGDLDTIEEQYREISAPGCPWGS